MKSFLFGAMPWVMVAIAAAIFALVVWQRDLSYWEPFKQTLAAMLIGAVVAQFGDGLAKGIREGLDKPK